MSGHSKWSTIKHKKGAGRCEARQTLHEALQGDHRRRQEGGAHPSGNLWLQNASRRRSRTRCQGHDRARNRRRAGTDAEAAVYETIVYEGYGPDGVAVLVEARLTTKPPRLRRRHTFSKHGGNLGRTGAVAWLFERRGVVLVERGRRRRGRADARGRRGRGGRRRARRRRLPGHVRARGAHRRAAGDRRRRDQGDVGRALDGPENDRRGGGGAVGEEADPPDRGARGERRHPGRLRELRHPRAGPGGGRPAG